MAARKAAVFAFTAAGAVAGGWWVLPAGIARVYVGRNAVGFEYASVKEAASNKAAALEEKVTAIAAKAAEAAAEATKQAAEATKQAAEATKQAAEATKQAAEAAKKTAEVAGEAAAYVRMVLVLFLVLLATACVAFTAVSV